MVIQFIAGVSGRTVEIPQWVNPAGDIVKTFE